jgi:hypothetical protein
LILRAGFVSGGPTAISDFGVAAISALVGLMTDEMTRKLRDIFDTLFGIKKPEEEKGESQIKKVISGIVLRADKTAIKIEEESKVSAKLLKGDGTPAKDTPTNFTIKDIKILDFIGDSNPKTDEYGNASVIVQGKDRGRTIVTVEATRRITADEIVITVAA